MYLSKLTIDPTTKISQDHFDNPYEMHRTIMSGFDQFTNREKANALYRLEFPNKNSYSKYPVLLVQSSIEPNWEKVKNIKGLLLYIPEQTNPSTKQFTPSFKENQILRFRLVANPTRRISNFRRIVPIRDENELIEWLNQKAQSGGFEIFLNSLAIERKDIYQFEKRKNDHSSLITLHQVEFNGYLLIKEFHFFLRSVEKGIGRGKSFGMGLLSLAFM
ncbi:MAG: type I-E CRISPR-associated protein Cas6/Cse3/CasE [Chloroflexi bacterium HGW-Chloroflexi-3]|nr:MAG: type I-E CRISPR-associated protein Cas6/Cse3/CasE [Chloroflexi bacterium HGW-Chloroflexi-3]